MNASRFPSQPKQQIRDLLPNEQEVSFDHVQNFLKRYRAWILGLGAVFILLIIGWTAWQIQRNKIIEQANLRFASAQTPEALQLVIQEFNGTDAALLATMILADIYFQQGQWDKAAATYQSVVGRYSGSPLSSSAIIGLASIAEVNGKTDEAIKAYQSVATMFSKSFQAPQAQFAAARLLESSGKLQEARKSYEDLMATHPLSAWKNEAMVRLQKINLLLKKGSA